MFSYKCHARGGNCDPEELENGVCFECRSSAVQKQEEKNCQTIREINKKIRERCVLQSDVKPAVGGRWMNG